MANEWEENLAEKRPIEVSMQSIGRTEKPPRPALDPDTRRHGGLGIMLASGALAFLLGGAGAWAYLNYLDPLLARQRVDAHQSKVKEMGATSAVADLAPRVDELTSRVERLQTDVERVSKNAAPPDLAPIDKRVSSLEDLPRKIEALEARVSALPTKIDQEGRKVTVLMAEMEGVRNQVSSLRNELPIKGISPTAGASSAGSSGRAASEPPREIAPPAGSSLQPAVELFNQGKYDKASESFASLTRSHPDDARVWYYAALARGLATRDWKGEAEKLVTEGVTRESAGTPAKSEIDSTFADLTSGTGKDWLAFYRRRAR